MPVLFSSTAESLGPSLYAAAASRYIFFAMKISPRISAVTKSGLEACDVCDVPMDASRKEAFSVGVVCAPSAPVNPTTLIATNQILEYTATSSVNNIGCIGQDNYAPPRSRAFP